MFIQNVLLAISELFSKDITKYKTVLPAAPIVPNKLPMIFANPTLVQKFQSVGRQLMYIMLATRSDISYPIGILACHRSNPSPDYITALLHLAGYLKNTIDVRVSFCPKLPLLLRPW